MKIKIRFSGRGGQGIKFVGSVLVKAAMEGNYNATLSIDYTPSVRGGPIFCDVIISSEPISYPFCDSDGDVFIAIDQKGIDRSSDCVYENTISFIDSNTVANPEEIIVFKSVGLAVQDAATAKLAFETAKAKGIGTDLVI